MSFGIHALDIGHIIVMLCCVYRLFGGRASNYAPDCQARPGTYRRAAASSYRRAGRRAHGRTDRGTGCAAFGCGLSCRGPTDLNVSVLATICIIAAELFE
ncbi:hypothetical protein [Methylomonas sp. 2B]|uniref:hypothetical protein n=1 Tax=Methylomonas sp. 2B TaxID=3367743 RepID=UPI0037C7F0C4